MRVVGEIFWFATENWPESLTVLTSQSPSRRTLKVVARATSAPKDGLGERIGAQHCIGAIGKLYSVHVRSTTPGQFSVANQKISPTTRIPA